MSALDELDQLRMPYLQADGSYAAGILDVAARYASMAQRLREELVIERAALLIEHSVGDRDLRQRFEENPVFHAAVCLFSKLVGTDGYTDDDGVRHDGPTLADLHKAAELEAAWRQIGFMP